MNQERPELVAEPQGAVMSLAQRLYVEIAAGQPAIVANGRIDGDGAARIGGLIGHDREVDLVVGVPEGDERLHRDRSAAAGRRPEIGSNAVHAQDIV
jgi:hypothetical protein